MQKSKPKNYKNIFRENGFVIFHNFLPDQFSYELVNKLLDIEKNWEYHSVLDNGENPYVKNVKREALQLYMIADGKYSNNLKKNFKDDNKNASESVDYMLKRNNKIYKKLSFLKYPIDNIFILLGIHNWRIVGLTYFIIYPGSTEQEVHHDSMKKMNRYFISIPLHDTPVNMGPTIFYSEKYIKNFRKTYVPKTLDDKKHGNIGFYDSLHYSIKPQFQKARTHKPLYLNDIAVHRDITFHAGGHNKSNSIRKFLFLICDAV
jgi:hypothetical protein